MTSHHNTARHVAHLPAHTRQAVDRTPPCRHHKPRDDITTRRHLTHELPAAGT